MHTIKITPNLLFEYQCTSGKFIRLPNRIESNRNFFCPNWNALVLQRLALATSRCRYRRPSWSRFFACIPTCRMRPWSESRTRSSAICRALSSWRDRRTYDFPTYCSSSTVCDWERNRAVLTNGHTGHVPRAPGFSFLFRGPQLVVVK